MNKIILIIIILFSAITAQSNSPFVKPTQGESTFLNLTIVINDNYENDGPFDYSALQRNRSIDYHITIYDINGNVLKKINGDLSPHLTQAQIDGLIGFDNDIRIKAESLLVE